MNPRDTFFNSVKNLTAFMAILVIRFSFQVKTEQKQYICKVYSRYFLKFVQFLSNFKFFVEVTNNNADYSI